MSTGDYPRCGAKKRSGETCGQAAGWGTPTPGVGRCKLHGGCTPGQQVGARKQLARGAVIAFGLTDDTSIEDVDPRDVLAEELWRTVLTVRALEHLVAELPHHPDDDTYVPEAQDGRAAHWKRGAPALYGRTYHLSGAPTGEAKPHVLWVMLREERKHLKEVAAECVKAGVETARVEIAEDQARTFAAMLRAMFADPRLELAPAQRQAALVVMADHLRVAE